MPAQTLCLHSKDDVLARLQAMVLQESTHYICPDYLASDWQASFIDDMDDEVSSAPEINEMWRMKICEWCYMVVDHFDLDREIVSVALSYLDRYLATRRVDRRIFQLASMTALYLSIKLFESRKIKISGITNLSRGYLLEEHIVVMEDSVLQSLGWHVHPPTPFSFVREMLNLLPVHTSTTVLHDTNELARFLTELSVCDYYFATKKASAIALAALLNALELHSELKVPLTYTIQLLQQLGNVGIDDAEVIVCRDRLRELYVAGGYGPASTEQPKQGRLATVSPTGPIEQVGMKVVTGLATRSQM